MKNPVILTFILACCLVAAHAETAASSFAIAKTYYICNVANGMYLSVTKGSLVLSTVSSPFTFKVSADGFYTVSSTSGTVGGSIHMPISTDGSGQYQDWLLEPVEGKEGVYLLANRQRESASFHFLAFSKDDVTDSLSLMLSPVKPGDYAPAQWRLVTEVTTDMGGVTTQPIMPAFHSQEGVYTVSGIKGSEKVGGLANLPSGIYIVDGKKTAKY